MVLSQQCGLSLMLVPTPDERRPHYLAIATEDPERRVFYDVATSQFPLMNNDLEDVGVKLQALGSTMVEDNSLESWFRKEGLW